MQCHQGPVVERHDCGCRDPLGQVVFAVSLRWPRSDCHLAKLTAQSHIVDAKSPYDVLSKGSAISRLDRRSDGDRGRLSRESHSLVGASFSDARRWPYEGGVGQHEWSSGALDPDQPLRPGAGASSHAAKR